MQAGELLLGAWRDSKTRRLFFVFLSGLLGLVLSYLWAGPLKKTPYRHLLSAGRLKRMEVIHIVGRDVDNRLKKDPISKKWWVNGRYSIDPYAQETLWNTLSQARTQQKLSPQEQTEVGQKMAEEGYAVVASAKDGDEKAFSVYGDSVRGVSYVQFPGEDTIYVLTIAGHAYYVAGIFSLSELQWKDRLFFSYQREALKKLSLYDPKTEQEKWQFVFKRGAPVLVGEAADRVHLGRVQRYVDHFARFYINEYILPGQLDLYDSILKNSKPFAILNITPRKEKGRSVVVYENDSEDYYLLRDEETLSLCEKKRFGALLREKKFFRKRINTFPENG